MVVAVVGENYPVSVPLCWEETSDDTFRVLEDHPDNPGRPPYE